MLNFLEEYSKPNDLSSDRILRYDSGLQVTIKSDQIHGFWSVTFSSGTTPKALQGVFTDVNRARNEVERYMEKYNEKNVHEKHVIQEVETQEDHNKPKAESKKPPVLKTKRQKSKEE